MCAVMFSVWVGWLPWLKSIWHINSLPPVIRSRAVLSWSPGGPFSKELRGIFWAQNSFWMPTISPTPSHRTFLKAGYCRPSMPWNEPHDDTWCDINYMCHYVTQCNIMWQNVTLGHPKVSKMYKYEILVMKYIWNTLWHCDTFVTLHCDTESTRIPFYINLQNISRLRYSERSCRACNNCTLP